MGIFSDNVRSYYEHNLIVLPCGNKRPLIGLGWQKYCNEKPDEKTIDEWESTYKDADQIGLTMGPSNGLCAFDFDYDYDVKKCTIKKAQFDKEKKHLERQIISLLPPTPCIKLGKKGWTRIYKNYGPLENAQADKNGLRLFDFLAKNKQTIIPPSKYNDGSDLHYKWIGPPIEDCLDEIPVITQEIVNEIKFIIGDLASSAGGGRHGLLFKWIKEVAMVEADNDKLADALCAYDIKINEIPYLSDKKHHTTSDAKQNAVKWITRIKKFLSVKESRDELKIDSNGWNYFFENSFYKYKKDIISKDIYVKRDNSEPWTIVGAVEDVLKSYAIQKKMPYSQTSAHLSRWIFEKTESDFLCDIPVWDGIDRISSFGDSIISKDFNGFEISEILKHWGSNIFRRVDSSENQNRCVLLKGPQGIGKDYLVRSMLKDFKPYYDSTTLPGTQKDALEICSRLLMVHIEEFDQTRNLDVSFIKSLITQPSAFFRESYGHSPNQKIMRPSFISTANVDDILRDPTGNRRFIVIPIDDIKWAYPKNQSLQVLSQFKHLKNIGKYEVLDHDIELKIKIILSEFTPDDLSETILELYHYKYRLMTGCNISALDQSVPYRGYTHLKYAEMADAIADIAKKCLCSLRRVQSVLKVAGLTFKSRDGVKCFASKPEMNIFKFKHLD